MFGMIGSGNNHNQPVSSKGTGHVLTEARTLLNDQNPCDQVNIGHRNEDESVYQDLGKLMAFAEANRKKENTGSLIEEAVMEQTVDPSLLNSDDEAYKKGMEKYLYNTDRTWDDVYRPPKTDEKTQHAELDAWQKGMAEYRARWD